MLSWAILCTFDDGKHPAPSARTRTARTTARTVFRDCCSVFGASPAGNRFPQGPRTTPPTLNEFQTVFQCRHPSCLPHQSARAARTNPPKREGPRATRCMSYQCNEDTALKFLVWAHITRHSPKALEQRWDDAAAASGDGREQEGHTEGLRGLTALGRKIGAKNWGTCRAIVGERTMEIDGPKWTKREEGHPW